MRFGMKAEPHNLTVASTGASGSEFLRQLLRTIERDERVSNVNLIVSENSLRVMAEELGIGGRNNLIQQLIRLQAQLVSQHDEMR